MYAVVVVGALDSFSSPPPCLVAWLLSSRAAKAGIDESDITAAEGPPVGARYRAYIVDQELYVAPLHHGGGRLCPESRWRYTVWGLLQLLRIFPEHRVPDVVVNFYCYDTPKVSRQGVEGGRFGSRIPFLLSYCSSADHLDVPWPDYSFFGWPELRIPSWESFAPGMLDIANYSAESSAGASGIARLWEHRDARLFWRGNLGKAARDRPDHESNWKAGYKGPNVALPGHAYRATLVRECTEMPGLLEMIDVDEVVWSETPEGASHKSRKLEDQCKNKFMMYLEGGAWSTSLKYQVAAHRGALCVPLGYSLHRLPDDAMCFFSYYRNKGDGLRVLWSVVGQAICGSALLGVEPFYSDFYSDYLIGQFADPSLKSVNIPRDQEKMCSTLFEQLKMFSDDPQR